ncbi:hypothetical protein AUR63_07590 [Guyparkeria sp. XI15]|nr:hypothetical protein AUR63_07590 [Guyparkeria sp. XI15]OAE88327.1 hypothetical protein AWR35_07605 [Guyparkeria sp. WRN-7]
MLLGAVVLSLGGCAMFGGPDGDQRTVIVYPGGDTSLDPVILPASELPPAGECRIWYPNRAVDQQPGPGDCDELRRQVPPGAVLVRG